MTKKNPPTVSPPTAALLRGSSQNMRPGLARPPSGPGAGEVSVDEGWVCSVHTLSPRCLASPPAPGWAGSAGMRSSAP